MPTMRSLGVTVPLRDRLSHLGCEDGDGLDGQPSQNADAVSSGTPAPQRRDPAPWTASGTKRAASTNAGRTPKQSHPPIHTPQALLSRDPSHLASALGAPTAAVLNLRALVADSMAMTAGNYSHGRESSKIVASVSLAIRNSFNTGCERITDHSKLSGELCGNEQSEKPLFQQNRPPAIISGAASSLDLAVLSSLAADSEPMPTTSPLSTGSLKLDELLTTPSDVICGGPSCWVQQSSVLPPNVRKRRRNGVSEKSCVFGPGQAIDLSGITPGLVTEVFGPSSVGKTQVALNVAANAALRGWTVHYLAGGGGSATVLPLARRLRQLLSERGQLQTTVEQSVDSSFEEKSPMDRVLFTTVPDGTHAFAALASIENSLFAQTGYGSDGASTSSALVILDSASGCLSPNLYSDGDGGAGAALVNEIGLMLRRLARTTTRGSSCGRCAVFVTNGTVSSSHGSSESSRPSPFKPAMGKLWRAPDIRVKFVIGANEGCSTEAGSKQALSSNGVMISRTKIVRATLVKHFAKSFSCNDASLNSVTFGISASGVIDV